MEHQRKSASKHASIVAAARKLFLGSGYGATSMDAIAAEANVSKRTVYSHFENKETLFAAIIGDMCHVIGDTGPNDSIPDGAPEKILYELGLHIIETALKPETMGVFRVILAESEQFPELGKAFWATGPETMKNHIARYLTDLDRRGILAVKDAEMSAFQFMGMIKWPYHMRQMFGAGKLPSKKQLESSVGLAVSTFLGGLSPLPKT